MADFSDTTPNDPFFNRHEYGVVPPSAVFQEDWPASGTITQGINGGLSMAGWTEGNEGFIQQSFLGASIRSFNISAGFGGTSSTVNIDLVNDEYHKSDDTPIGIGDDVYHGGEKDHFNPPVVGSPVFFKFGKNHATVEQAFRQTFDDTYINPDTSENYKTMSAHPDTDWPKANLSTPIQNHPQGYYLSSGTRLDELSEANEKGESPTAEWVDKTELLNDRNSWRGKYHFVFGGILQSYTQNKSSAGNPLYNVKLTDPRDILQNTQVLLNNYQGTTFNNKNLFNVYGFLEYDPSDQLKKEFEKSYISKEVLTKFINPDGNVSYINSDIYRFGTLDKIFSPGMTGMENVNTFPKSTLLTMPAAFPITGQGLSRRSERGIPWYRVSQALAAMWSEHGYLPKEYRDAGFGGTIDFRGYKYIVDFSGIPLDRIPQMYYLDFDKLDLLSLAQELCDIISHDLFVSLLPVIDHPACKFLFDYNKEIYNETQDPTLMIAGIIRVDAIDRSEQPDYGSIKSYIEDLASHNMYVENQDVGFEVSNVTTDKFVAGAQEVEMYYFHTNNDRDTLQERRRQAGLVTGKYNLEILEQEQWSLATSLKQQVLPFYGFLGGKAVTIPRGFGSYQQIMLDARNLDAHGVGNYYIATEMELRAALVSFKQWSNFLLTYNEVYIQELSQYQALYAELASEMTEVVNGINTQLDPDSDVKKMLDQLIEEGRDFGVAVPRCVFNSDKPNCKYVPGSLVYDGYPASPCSPPFGYPLYYKRAEKIGIPQAGMVSIQHSFQTAISNIERLQKQIDAEGPAFKAKIDDPLKSLSKLLAFIKKLRKNLRAQEEVGNDVAAENIRAQLKVANREKHEIDLEISKVQEQLDIAVGTGKAMKLATKKSLQSSRKLTKNMTMTAKQHLKNARKVYAFVKKVADECLGKKFLVKIPNATNLKYANEVVLYTEGNTDAVFNIQNGPFGFRPLPISTDPNYSETDIFTGMLDVLAQAVTSDSLYEHYLNIDHSYGIFDALPNFSNGYRYGALKSNFNPIAERWEHNYAPEPQGGFFSYEQFSRNLNPIESLSIPQNKLPKSQKQLLAPLDLKKMITDNNRISCYVRFDHSQFLDFHNIGGESIEQQAINRFGQFVPDLMETLPNMNPDKTESMNKIQARLQNDRDYLRQGPSVAFVKCTIDDELYMAPKIVSNPTAVFARQYTVNIPPPDYETTDVIDDRETDTAQSESLTYGQPNPTFGCMIKKRVFRRLIPSFGVPLGGGADGDLVMNADFARYYDDNYRGDIVLTEDHQLNPNHVYALITIPGKVIPSIDSRYLDSVGRAFNAPSIDEILTTDVVKIREFSRPAFKTFAPPEINCNDPVRYGPFGQAKKKNKPGSEEYDEEGEYALDDEGNFIWIKGIQPSFETITKAMQAQRDALKGITLSSPDGLLSFTSPSPVYPNLVALPLMSMERCYGPWLSASDIDSSRVKYSDIGGKVEFDKDENLAPWNFAGYQLMNEAGELKTQFSNSLLLFSERGGFVYPGAPTGVALAKALKNRGPLVTSIDVSVSNSIKTTVKMDLYTSRFGKLQKQQEDAINQVARERQKIVDQRNNAIRRGLSKGQANSNLMGGLLKNGGQSIINAANMGTELFTAIEMGDTNKIDAITMSYVEDRGGDNIRKGHEGIMQNVEDLWDRLSVFTGSAEQQSHFQKTAGATISELFKPFSTVASAWMASSRSSKNKDTGH